MSPSQRSNRSRLLRELERLEDRIVPTLEPITTIDPSRVGLTALGTSSTASVSDDGQVVAFQSDAPDLVSNDANGVSDVFVYFRVSDRVELVSVNQAGTASGNNVSKAPSVSPDGRYVLFETSSNDIVPGSFATQIVARDLHTNQSILISSNNLGQPGNGNSTNGSWSEDGTRVVFESSANNLSAIDGNGQVDVFLRDLNDDTTTLVSINQGATAAGNGKSYSARISRDGDSVVFLSRASDLVAGDVTGPSIDDVYVRDLSTGMTELVSVDTSGANQANASSVVSAGGISPDGRFVAFHTAAGNIAGLPVFGGNNQYLRDRLNGTTTLVSVNASGTAGVGGFSGSVTPDGKFVAFVSPGTDLDPNVTDTNGTFDVFLRDMTTGTTTLVTVNVAGTASGNGLSVFAPQLSADGRFVAFFSEASDLSADPDGNATATPDFNRRDVFIRDMTLGKTTNVSAGGNSLSQLQAVSADFKTIAFETMATNLTAGDRNNTSDVLVRDLSTGAIALASRRDPSFPPEILGGGGIFSTTPDGRFVAFNGGPSADLAPGVTFTGFGTGVAYVHDRQTGINTVVDLTPDPTISGGGFNPILTPDARFVSFVSRVPTGGAVPLVNGITFVGHFFSGRDVYVRDLATGVTKMVSVDPSGSNSSDSQVTHTPEHAISDNGRYVAFTSVSANLVTGLSNPSNFSAVYLRDLWTGKTVLVSRNVADDGTISGNSTNLRMSHDGRYVTFTSTAEDLSALDGNGKSDVFQWDRTTGLVTLVSVNQAGTGSGDDNSGGETGFRPVMTPDGRYVAFGSRATDLVAADTNGRVDVFVRDMQTGITRMVSINEVGTNGGNFDSTFPTISDDGQRIAFVSLANNLTATPTPGFLKQAFVRDMNAGTTQMISVVPDGSIGGNRSTRITAEDGPTLSPDGRFVAFRSEATDLITGFVDANGLTNPDLYLRDLMTDTTQLVTYGESGTTGATGIDSGFRYLFVGPGAPELLFDSKATNLYPGDINGAFDVFAFRIEGNGQIRGSVSNDSTGAPLAGVAVYLDTNGNHRPDPGEPRLLTDAAGGYAFTNLPAGKFTVGVLLPNGFVATSPTHLSVTLATDSAVVIDQNFGSVPAAVDLGVTNLFVPTDIAAGRPFTVTWVTANFGNQPVVGDWQEAVYLSADRVLDGSDILLGTLSHVGGLAGSSSVGRSLTVSAPATLTGEYFVFVQADRRHQVTADTNRTNNIAFSFEPTSLTIPEVTFAGPVADSFAGPNQDRYFQIIVEPGRAVRLTLDSAGLSGGTELYASFGVLPTPQEFDHSARGFGQPDQALTIPLTRPGTYFVLARSRFGEAATAPFTLSAVDATLELDTVGPNVGGNTGRVTVEVIGTGFAPGTAVSLIGTGAAIIAEEVQFRDASRLFATFDLTGQAVGAYDVRVQVGAQFATLSGAFTVEMGISEEDALQLSLTVPDRARVDRVSRVVVEYENTGNTDIDAPLLHLSLDNGSLLSPGSATVADGGVTFLGGTSSETGGVLRPGERGRFEIEFVGPEASLGTGTFQLFRVDDNRQIDWGVLEEVLRPETIAEDAWRAIYTNFQADVGNSERQYQQLLARNAAYLANLGIFTSDPIRLLQFAFNQANGTYTPLNYFTIIDGELPVPGENIRFIRERLDTISGRYRIGPFGRGWTHNWDIEAITLTTGDVIVRQGSRERLFSLSADGSYVGNTGEFATLTRSIGRFTLTEVDGSLILFRPDGLFEFTQDPRGGRVTAVYDILNRLGTLTHTNGGTFVLTYTAFGRIATLSDLPGRLVAYSYNTHGDHLTSVSDAFGTQVYFYESTPILTTNHTLVGIQFGDNALMNFEYDARGRLIGEKRNFFEQPITYTYLPGAAFTATDAIGSTTTIFLDDRGQLAREIDPLGRGTNWFHDADENLIRLVRPLGVVFQATYDGQGNLLTLTEPTGATTRFSYDTRGNLIALTDASGQETVFTYDAGNNLIQTVYANGSVEAITYDAAGNPASFTNRRDDLIAFEYNAEGLITQKTFPDGSSITYTYDGRDRLITATDPSGSIFLDYNNQDNLIRVTYPGGRSLEFTYDVIGRRSSMTDQDGFTVNFTYDNRGQLEQIGGAFIVGYTHDAARRLIREEKLNGTSTTYEYDLAGQLITLIHFHAGGGINARFDYTYDELGRRTSMTLTDSDPSTTDGATQYSYDPIGQLVSIMFPDGRLITYEYDAVGNRVSVTDGGVATPYLTDSANQYVQVGDTTYGYDRDGNLVAAIDTIGTTIYSYDVENRLIGIEGPGSTITFSYNALGHRDSVTIDGVVTNYLIDPVEAWTVVGEYDAIGDVIARYAHGQRLIGRQDANGIGAFYDLDANFNVVGLTNGIGDYINRYSYLPFGETTTHAAGVMNPFTFVGGLGILDDGNSLFSMRFREYDARTGRFTSNDPIGLGGGDVNLRRYAGNNPVSRTDEFGLQSLPLDDMALSYLNKAEQHLDKNPDVRDNVRELFRENEDLAAMALDSLWIGRHGTTLDGPSESTTFVTSNDPNDITGPVGVDAPRFLTGEGAFLYTIRFENLPEATAAAQEVFVTHILDADLDLATFQFGDLGFGDAVIDVTLGLQAFSTRFGYQNPDGSPLRVDISAALDIETRTVTWTFLSVDPATGLFPAGVDDGFLPPNLTAGEGEGFVSYTIRALPGLTTNTTIDQQASIVFDTNEAIETNVFTYTIDRDAPTSAVNALPATTTDTSFLVSWTGTDLGSGIVSFDVFVSTDGGSFVLWLDDTTATSATFTGEVGRTYGFFSVATDAVGLTESAPAVADASIHVEPEPSVPPVAPPAPPVVPVPPVAPPVSPVSPPVLPVSPPAPPAPPPVVPVPPAVPATSSSFAVGSGAGVVATVRIFGPDGTERSTRNPFGDFSGGVRIAMADLNGDGVDDLVVGTGPGIATLVLAFDGMTGAEIFRVEPFESSFLGGVFVAAGDINGDGFADVVITPDQGGGPRVRIFSGADASQLADFFGIEDPNFRGGARAALGDLNGDGRLDLLVAAGFGGGPRLAGFDGPSVASGINMPEKLFPDFFLFEQTLRNGIFVTAGDLDGDGADDVIAGGGPGGGPRIFALSGRELAAGAERPLANFFAGDAENRGGVRITAKDLDGDGLADIVAASGTGAPPRVTAYPGKDVTPDGAPPAGLELTPFDADFLGGVFVG